MTADGAWLSQPGPACLGTDQRRRHNLAPQEYNDGGAPRISLDAPPSYFSQP